MSMVNIKINGMPLCVPEGISILEASRYAGIEIPTLCYLKKIFFGAGTQNQLDTPEEGAMFSQTSLSLS